MAMGMPVSRFQQPGAEQPELHYLSADSVDLYPVPNPHAVWSHQNKPTAECQDEILKIPRQSCGCQTQDGWHLSWYTENSQQDQQEADQLRSQIQDCFQGLFLTR